MSATTFKPNTRCVALQDFQQDVHPGELQFCKGDIIYVLKESQVKDWYYGRDARGNEGLVPGPFLEDDDYVQMEPSPKDNTTDPSFVQSVYEREQSGRLKSGTFVVARASYVAENPTDLSFDAGEDFQIVEPAADLGWYEAKRCHANKQQKKQGLIPITHFRLLYDDSDSEDDDEALAGRETESIYDDINDFLSTSGWFSYHGKPFGMEALHYVVAKKAGFEYDHFMTIDKAVYKLVYGAEEKVYIGYAHNLPKDINKHFECFGKPQSDIRTIDDELCHHTYAKEWSLEVFPVAASENVELLWAKKLCQENALVSVTCPPPDSPGINDCISFSDFNTWKQFQEWFYPKTSQT